MTRLIIIEKVKQVVHKIAPDAKIILYGSEARGEASSDSDIDILILLDRDTISYKEKTEITDHLYDVELETGVSVSPLIYTRKQWESRPFITPFYLNVVNEGIVL